MSSEYRHTIKTRDRMYTFTSPLLWCPDAGRWIMFPDNLVEVRNEALRKNGGKMVEVEVNRAEMRCVLRAANMAHRSVDDARRFSFRGVVFKLRRVKG